MKMNSLKRVSALVAACAISLCFGCRDPQPDREHLPVVLIGLDGLEWNVVLEMIEEDRLPTIASLIDGGVYGELAVTKPTLSPIIWTSTRVKAGATFSASLAATVAKRHWVAGFAGSQSAKR